MAKTKKQKKDRELEDVEKQAKEESTSNYSMGQFEIADSDTEGGDAYEDVQAEVEELVNDEDQDFSLFDGGDDVFGASDDVLDATAEDDDMY